MWLQMERAAFSQASGNSFRKHLCMWDMSRRVQVALWAASNAFRRVLSRMVASFSGLHISDGARPRCKG